MTGHITLTEYIEHDCDACSGTGAAFDVTNLDSATGTVDPSGRVQCSSCAGRGFTLRLPAPPAMIRETEAIRARQAVEPIGDMPEWMC